MCGLHQLLYIADRRWFISASAPARSARRRGKSMLVMFPYLTDEHRLRQQSIECPECLIPGTQYNIRSWELRQHVIRMLPLVCYHLFLSLGASRSLSSVAALLDTHLSPQPYRIPQDRCTSFTRIIRPKEPSIDLPDSRPTGHTQPVKSATPPTQRHHTSNESSKACVSRTVQLASTARIFARRLSKVGLSPGRARSSSHGGKESRR
ncbi:hypothetical protein KC342_g100 [Hortaea werneckii]|nr:hypothetical protein KC342_g100 [Hortaea werneckii]